MIQCQNFTEGRKIIKADTMDQEEKFPQKQNTDSYIPGVGHGGKNVRYKELMGAGSYLKKQY